MDEYEGEAVNEASADPQARRGVLAATRAFASESKPLSWWLVGSTLGLMVAALAGAAAVQWWPLRTALAVLGALLMVRAFITYHDFMHGAILRGSRLATFLFEVYGAFALTPPRSWKKSHNFHHTHVGELSKSGTGSFPLITTRMWKASTPAQRAGYRASRHPLIVVFGYVTVFFYSICLQPLLTNPKKHWDSALALFAHGGLIAALWFLGGFSTAFFTVLLPMALASFMGSYLFFAQHSFRRMQIVPEESWSFDKAALASSSYMRLNRVLQWFTGNIGFHHVHHLNVQIPFYRLPEAMAAIPALQAPATITLSPRDIMGCFQSSLWDEEGRRMVSYREARALS